MQSSSKCIGKRYNEHAGLKTRKQLFFFPWPSTLPCKARSSLVALKNINYRLELKYDKN